MKKLTLVAMLALAGIGTSAHAATATGSFDVTITLTSACRVVSAPTAAFTYTAFQAAASTISSSFNIQCTNLLPISSVRLDNGAGGLASALSQNYTDAATNLAYTLALVTPPTVGTGANQSISLTGSMAADQPGTCATATCTNSASANKTRTITVTY
jgi:spore coat protein U-like protein